MKIQKKTLFKAVLSFGLLGILFYRTDIAALAEILKSANWLMIVPAIFILCVTPLLQTVRWSIILRSFNVSVRYLKLCRIVLIGCFFNLFLPSSVGGDFFRAYYLGRHERIGVTVAAATTLIDRLSGMFALMLLGLVCSFYSPQSLEGIPLQLIFLGIFVVFTTGIIVFFHPVPHRLLEKFLARIGAGGLAAKTPPIYEGTSRFRKNIPDLLLTTGLSIIIQIISIFSVWVAARAMNIDAPFLLFLVFIPLINIAIAVPLTINGVGLREGMYFLLFSQIGVPMEASITLSLVTFFMYMAMALPGGVVYAMFKKDEDFPREA